MPKALIEIARLSKRYGEITKFELDQDAVCVGDVFRTLAVVRQAESWWENRV